MSNKQALAAELKGAALPSLDALSDAEAGSLARSIRDARRRQKQHLSTAFEAALTHVPLLLRGPVRKILFP